MVKKKRQTEDVNDNSSTESCEDVQVNSSNASHQGTSCPHISKSTDPTKLRKALQKFGIDTRKCSECVKQPDNESTDSDLYEYDKRLWLCLKCGSQLCGRARNQHAMQHYLTPRSDSHAIVVETKTWNIWCYQCDVEVSATTNKKLLECISIVKREAQKPPPGVDSVENIKKKIVATFDTMRPLLLDGLEKLNTNASLSLKSLESNEKPDLETLKNTIDMLPRVRGLSNLGNTCFFNAVVQCLAQTPFLLEILKESAEAGEKFQLPGGKLGSQDNIELAPISGELNQWGIFTSTLAETLEELQTISGGVFTPHKLLGQLTSKWPQFGGGDQHDSHELLRHLLESVRSEDLRRYQSVILNYLGYNSKVDPTSVEGDIRQKIKFYGNQATDRILRPEPVFRGFLVSTLTCQDCYHTSSRHEYFLDISLPVSVEKPQPPQRRKNSPEPATSVLLTTASISKTQSKKEKRLDRKTKHAQFKVTSKKSSASQENEKSPMSSSVSVSESDADIEDNVTDDPQRPNRKGNDAVANDFNDKLKSPHSFEKRGDTPENPFKNNPVPSNEVFEASLSVSGSASLINKQNQCNILSDLQKLSVSATEKSNVSRRGTKQQRQRTCSHVDWSNTLAPRYQCEDGECSIQSCLNNFTGMEFMTGNNKVSCESCNSDAKKNNEKIGKTVYSNATKQFLISSPPAVLILHLKRFQVGSRGMFRKITKHVTFPLVLDIAPFCGSKVKKLPNIRPQQKKLLYSLYGVTEHSGSMGGGHYIAYVKVRPKFSDKDSRWGFLPKGSKAEIDQTDEQRVYLEKQLAKSRAREQSFSLNDSDDSTADLIHSSCSENEEEGAIGGSDTTELKTSSPPGKWYHVSDSRVQEVSEDTVLNAQAYLLFYERIF